MKIIVNINQQKLFFYDQGQKIIYPISSAKNGTGQEKGSEKTPLGKHIIRAKIGDGLPINTVFIARRPTGEIFEPSLLSSEPKRDWILTRILWLSGMELGKNRLGNVDTMQRYIYIHGTPDCFSLEKATSHGCLRMHNDDILDLFDRVKVGCPVEIRPL